MKLITKELVVRMKKLNQKKSILILGVFILGSLTVYYTANAASTASASANSTVKVIANIAISKDVGKDLLFADAARNDAAQTIAAGDATAAAFSVSGEANHTYTVTLPANGTVTMITGAGAVADDQIAVSNFTSSPAAGNNGLLDGSGAQALTVGATRAAIRATQTQANDYTASFSVTVTYY